MDLYESAHEFAEIGAGVGIWPRGWAVVRELGIESDLKTIANITGEFQMSCSAHVTVGKDF